MSQDQDVLSYAQFEKATKLFTRGYNHGIDRILILGGLKAIQEWYDNNHNREGGTEHREFCAGWLASIMTLQERKNP